MHPIVYISSYVKGPIQYEPKGRRRVSPWAFRISDPDLCATLRLSHDGNCSDDRTFYQLEAVDPAQLKAGDMVLIENGQSIHTDGVIRKGAALVDESAVTGDSMHVLRESGGRNQVMRDTMIVSGAIIVEVTPRLGHSLDWIAHSKRAVDVESGRAATPKAILVSHKSTVAPEQTDDCSGK